MAFRKPASSKRICTLLRRLYSDIATSEVEAVIKHSTPTFPERIFSGIQPTGVPHLGNYFGAICNWIQFQNSGKDVIYSIVDLHSITLPQDPNQLWENIKMVTSSLLACGIDPDKSTLFLQSTVPEHTQLAWILGCLTTLPRLAALPQYKEKCGTVKDVPLGLFVYPVLQSADILIYRGTHVPVGEDQLQHIQLANHLARRFNNQYGPCFPQPKIILHDATARIKSLRKPDKKMSKSDLDARSRIELTDSCDVIRNKLKKAVTDDHSNVTYDPEKRLAVSNLITLYGICTGDNPEQVCARFQGKNTSQFKMAVAEVVCDVLRPIQDRYFRLIKDPSYLRQVLHNGSLKARDIAAKTLSDVYRLVGFNRW